MWILRTIIPYINSLWRHISWSTSAPIMLRSMTVPIHFLKTSWLRISKLLRHAPWGNLSVRADTFALYNGIKNYTFKITAASYKGQWVKRTTSNGACFLTVRTPSGKQDISNIAVWSQIQTKSAPYILVWSVRICLMYNWLMVYIKICIIHQHNSV